MTHQLNRLTGQLAAPLTEEEINSWNAGYYLLKLHVCTQRMINSLSPPPIEMCCT